MRSITPLLATLAFTGSLAAAGAVHAQQAAQDTLWQTRCAGPSRSAEALTCETSQSLLVKETGKLLFKIDVIYPPNKAAPVLQMQAPLGFYLPGKIKLAVDGAPVSELAIGTCDARGCFLSAPASDGLISAMKAGAKMQIDFAPTAEKRQSVDVPLTGFSRAIKAIQ